MSQLTPGTALGFLIADAARLYRHSFEKEIEVSGLALTAGEFRTLAYVTAHEGSRQSVLADLMGVEPMTLSAYLDGLERQRLVTRAVDGSDRRVKVIRSTSAANRMIEQVMPIADDIDRRAVSGLSDDQVHMLRVGLLALRTNLDRVSAAQMLDPGL